MIESQAFYRVLDQSEESDVTDLFSHWSDQLALTVQRSSVRATEGLQTEYNQQTDMQTIIIADIYIANNYKADNHSRQSSSQQTIIIIADTHHHSRQSSSYQTIIISDTRHSSTIIIADKIIIADNHHHSRQLYSRQSYSRQSYSRQS